MKLETFEAYSDHIRSQVDNILKKEPMDQVCLNFLISDTDEQHQLLVEGWNEYVSWGYSFNPPQSNHNNESVLQHKESSLSSTHSLVDSQHSSPSLHDLAIVYAESSTDSENTDEEESNETLSLYKDVNWDFREFDSISPFKHHPIRTAGMLIDDKAEIPDSWKGNILRPRLTVSGVMCDVKVGLEKCIRDAWESPEWSTNPLRTSRKHKGNLVKVIAVTKYVIDFLMRYGKCSQETAKYACGNFNWGMDYIHLMGTPIGDSKYVLLKWEGSKLIVDPFIWKMNSVEEAVDNKSVTAAYDHSCSYFWQQQAGSKLLTAQYESWLQLTKPDLGYVRTFIRGMVGEKHKGKEIVSETTVPRPEKGTPEYKKAARKVCWVEEWIEIFEYYNNDNRPYFYGNDMDRIYGPYQQLPSNIRQLYLYRGKRLRWIDYSSMHPTLILLEYLKKCKNLGLPDFETEEAIIKEILGIDRDMIMYPEHNPRDVLLAYAQKLGLTKITSDVLKVFNLMYYNESIKDMKKNPVTWLYKKLLPGFHEWLVNSKKIRDVEYEVKGEIKVRKNCGYKVTSRWMLNMEARIMEEIIYKIRDAGIFCMLCHDGIDVEAGKELTAMDIFTRTLISWKLPVNITVE